MDNNGISKELVEYLVNTGKELEKKSTEPKEFKMENRSYLCMNGQTVEVRERDVVAPQVKAIFTLQGLVDFIKADVDHLFCDPEKRYIVSVLSPNEVRIVSPLCGQKNERHVVAICEYKADRIDFDRYMDPETFVVMLMSRFADEESRAMLLSVIGNMADEQSGTTTDDGVTQRITVKKGVTMNGIVAPKNPNYLTPLRTFPEVEQPQTPFVLRVKAGDPEEKTKTAVALFECDGGAWKVFAVKNICMWLKTQLAGCNVEVIG